MRRFRHAIGTLLGLVLPTSIVFLIAAREGEMFRVVSVWPILASSGISVVTWWLQGLVYAMLARPQLKNLRVSDMFRVEMAGLFVALMSPIRGAELPYKAYLLKRLSLSGAEGTNLVITRVLLDVVVLTPAALAALTCYGSAFPGLQNPNPLVIGLIITATLAAFVFLRCTKVWRRARGITILPIGTGWRAKTGAKVSGFVRDVRRSFALYWHRGSRATLVYAVALTVVYWAFRLSVCPLALIAVGWSGDWLDVLVAQLILVSFVLPFAPTPGGGGARELGLAALLAGYVPEGQLLSGLIVYSALSHWLPLIASAFFAGHELSRGMFRRGGRRKATYREGHTEAITGVLPAVTPATPPQHHVSFRSTEREETGTWQPAR